jgi:dTDP-L-rhamnose 4-epimerase
LNLEAELIVGDVCDPEALARALAGVDAVVHLAAMVGVGQSMYELARYTQVNNLGTALLLEALINKPVERLVVASSMSLYGEGLYQGASGQLHETAERRLARLQEGDWEVYSEAGEVLSPLPTPESKKPSLASVYALSKYDQERLCLMVGRAYGVATVALRFFNVYGTRQALSNPYTGVLAIFAARLLNGKPPMIFEDGYQKRDFVSVHDVTRACVLALTRPEAAGQAVNVGSGQAYSVREIALRMAGVLGVDIAPQISGDYRVGDIRHCFADIALAKARLGYEPQVGLEDGLTELASWLEGQVAVDRVMEARQELAARGLTV